MTGLEPPQALRGVRHGFSWSVPAATRWITVGDGSVRMVILDGGHLSMTVETR